MSYEGEMTIIRPRKSWWNINWGEIWKYRELLYFFAWRDVKVRYKQTVIGFAWAIIQPFMTMIVFSLFFGKFAKISSEGLPYPVFYYSTCWLTESRLCISQGGVCRNWLGNLCNNSL